jgi:chromate transport protein ChrA
VFYLTALVVTFLYRTEVLLLFIAAGLIYMFIKVPPKFTKATVTKSILLFTGIGFWSYNSKTLSQIAWFFTKAGAFVFGSGLAIIPFLHGAVTDYHWINEHEFLDAVAVSMITPGPVVITVGFIGYLVAGFPGACVAAATLMFLTLAAQGRSNPLKHFLVLANRIQVTKNRKQSYHSFINSSTTNNMQFGVMAGRRTSHCFCTFFNSSSSLTSITGQ